MRKVDEVRVIAKKMAPVMVALTGLAFGAALNVPVLMAVSGLSLASIANAASKRAKVASNVIDAEAKFVNEVNSNQGVLN